MYSFPLPSGLERMFCAVTGQQGKKNGQLCRILGKKKCSMSHTPCTMTYSSRCSEAGGFLRAATAAVVALKWNFLKACHHRSPGHLVGMHKRFTFLIYNLVCLRSSIAVWMREVEQGLIHLEVLVCTSSPWVGQGLQSISLSDAPSAAWLFRSLLFGMIFVKSFF